MPESPTTPSPSGPPAEQTASRRSNARAYAIGVVIYALVFLLAFRYFIIYEKSFVWIPDGAAQHFPALYYFNRIVRAFLAHPSAGFPFWSWDLGLGADTIGALSFYVLGDPFALVSLLFPMHSMELAFTVAAIVRIACAGLFSAMYIRKMGARPTSVLIGSLIYSFTTFTIYSTMHHPMWATALALFPLMLLGVEYALERRRYWVLVLAVFLSAVGNYYFFYMAALTLVVYAVARYFELTPTSSRWRDLLPMAARVAGCVVLGILFAAPLLAPSAAAVLDTARRQVAFHPELFFTLREYGRTLAAVMSTVIAPNSVVLGFAPLALLLVPVIYLRKGNGALKWMLFFLPLALASPVLSSAYNAFTFPTGRFGFHWLLFLALATALLLSDDRPLRGVEVAVTGVIYALVWALVFISDVPINAILIMPCILGALTWLVFFIEWWLARTQGRHGRRNRLEAADPTATAPDRRTEWAMPVTRWALLALVIVGIGAFATLAHGEQYRNYLKDDIDAGKVMSTYLDEPGTAAASLEDTSFYRVMDSQPHFYNDGLVQEIRGTAYYFSVLDKDVTDFIVDNDIRGGWSSFAYSGVDDRAALGELATDKYYTAEASRTAYVPFGYELLKREKQGDVYENRYALPIGFLYDATIPRSEFETLPLVARQMAMLEGAVVDDGTKLPLRSVTPSVTVVDVPFSYTATGCVADVAAGRIEKLAVDSGLNLRFSAPKDAELYIHLDDFDDVPTSPWERRAYLLGKDPTPQKVAALKLKDKLWWRPLQLLTTYSAGGVTKSESWQSPEYPYYWGNRTQLINLGYKTSVTTTATMRFDVPGTLTFSSLKVLALPMADYPARAEKLRADAMTDVSVGMNRLSGTITAEKPALLFLSVPFSRGWQAFVDGQPVSTVRVNTAFTGIPISPGTHSIEMRYTTPWLAAGLLGFALAFALSLVAWLVGRRVRREGAKARA